MLINEIVGGASNIKTGDNPPFAVKDFLEIYPQFGENDEGNWNVPSIVIEMYLDMASSSIKEARWHKQWKIGMSLYIAHFCTLYLQGIADVNGSIEGIVQAGSAQGRETSVSVGDVSISTDYSLMNTNMNTWTGWGITIYGQQLMSLGRIIGKGGMFIH